MGNTVATAQFFFHGRRHYTQTGYRNAVSRYTSPVQTRSSIGLGSPDADGTDMTDRVVVITGANSGIGKELATYSAAKGARVYMICRNETRARVAAEEIITATNNRNVHAIVADVGEMTQVRRAVEELRALEERVDCLVCNAGALQHDYAETDDGVELHFACHLAVGSYMLSHLLLPQLHAGIDPRAIFVSSAGMYGNAFPSWEVASSTTEEQQRKFNGVAAYSFAKRGQVLLAERLSRASEKVKWVSCHPGWTDTAAVKDAFGTGAVVLKPLRQAWEGAEGIAWLMAVKGTNLVGGAFYLDRFLQPKHIAGRFMTEGTYTKNSEKEVDEIMEKLKEMCKL